jgi:hypothetical protein
MSRTLTCLAVFLTSLASVANAEARDQSALTERRTSAPFNLVNATADSVMSVAVATSGSDDFTPVDLGGALTGGLNAVAFQLPAGPCLRDLQVTFTHQRVSRLKGIDVCRTHGLRLDSLKGRMMTPDTLANDGPTNDRIVP